MIQRKLIQPPSEISSLASRATYKTSMTVREARQTNIECMVSSQVFKDVTDHLDANRDWLGDEARSGDEVLVEAYSILNELGNQADGALDIAFEAGTLSSGLEEPERESIPTVESNSITAVLLKTSRSKH